MSIKGSVRSGQLVTTYGVGAMVAAGNESFIVAGIDRWNRDEDFEFHEPRLERMLHVQAFMRPPSTGESDSWDVPVRRFPLYHSCPTCHRLNDIKYFESPFGQCVCSLCDDQPDLVPSRFVTACEDGHLDDFPYYVWVHRNHPHEDSNGKSKLKLRTLGEGAGLRDVIIECSCGAKESMDGAFGKKALQGVKRCSGNRPWLAGGEAEGCDKNLITIQRGASNVWFSDTVSAISIPPWSDRAFKVLDRHWKVLKAVPAVALEATIEALGIADDEHSVADLLAVAIHRKAQETDDVDMKDVKSQEYEALMRGAAERPDHQFVCVPAAEPGELAKDWIPVVNQVTRLREVRVLRGFSRLLPPKGADADDGHDGSGNVVRLPGPEHGWLPAIEVIGEGVFLELTSPRLAEWESRPKVQARVARLAQRYAAAGGWDKSLEVTPRFVLLHSLSHALIDQWALESGYSAAALTERLYVTPDRASVLIYTATSDSAGSLGGVVAMTDDSRLDSSLVEAIKRASWCSADPLCIETATQGADALNLAACHACSLLPETSCEHRNQLLDRALLVGTPDEPTLGFFADLV